MFNSTTFKVSFNNSNCFYLSPLVHYWITNTCTRAWHTPTYTRVEENHHQPSHYANYSCNGAILSPRSASFVWVSQETLKDVMSHPNIASHRKLVLRPSVCLLVLVSSYLFYSEFKQPCDEWQEPKQWRSVIHIRSRLRCTFTLWPCFLSAHYLYTVLFIKLSR